MTAKKQKQTQTQKQKFKFPEIEQFIFIDDDGDEIFYAKTLEDAKEEWKDSGQYPGFLYKRVPVYRFEEELKIIPVK